MERFQPLWTLCKGAIVKDSKQMSDVGFSFTKLCSHRRTDQKILFDETLCYHLPAEKKSYTILKYIHDSWFHSSFWNESARWDATASKKFKTYFKKSFHNWGSFLFDLMLLSGPNDALCPLWPYCLFDNYNVSFFLFPFYNYSS